MGWLSKLQRRNKAHRQHDAVSISSSLQQRNKAQRHDTASVSSSDTVDPSAPLAKNEPSRHGTVDMEEEMLRKVIRRIMTEEAGKLDKVDHVEELVTKEALVIKKEEEEERIPPEEDSDTASTSQASSVTTLRRATSSGTSQQQRRQYRHQRSIQDVLAGTPPQDDVSVLDDSIRSYIHPENVTNKQFDATVKHVFPGALDNYSLIKQVSSLLLEKQGYTKANTLLATSFCCDEASRQLEDDLEETYGRNFNLGGLAGFPWAGQTGFAAMAHHIPEGGHCLLVYGPHVGITKEGLVGKVERAGICKPDTCCGSAVAASNYVKDITEGRCMISTNLNSFTDFQQGAVQQMILPHCKRLDEATDRMLELPYALFESQDLLMKTIAENGASATPMGVVLLGGIQINTGPTTPDYFHPLRFSYMNVNGEIVEDFLAEFCEQSGSKHDADGRVQRARDSVFSMMGGGGGSSSRSLMANIQSSSSRSLTAMSQQLSPNGRRISEQQERRQQQQQDKLAEAVASLTSNSSSDDDEEDIIGESSSDKSEEDDDDEATEMVVPKKTPTSTKRRLCCAQEPGGDHFQSKSIVTKHIDMTGVISGSVDC